MKMIWVMLGIMLVMNINVATALKVNIPSIISNVTDFLGLTDTPNSYVGQGGNCVAVNGGETGLEFVACGSGTGGNTTDEIFAVVNNGTFLKIANIETCAGTDKLSYNGSHLLCLNDDTGGGGGNTTVEIQTAINNSGYYNITINWSNVLNSPSFVDTDTFNNSAEIWYVIDNGTFIRYQGYYNSSLINETQFLDIGGELNLNQSWYESLWQSIWGTKDTDDLPQGSTNFYDNQSWNETRFNSLDKVGQNSTWEGNASRIEGNIAGNSTWNGNKTNWADCPAGEYQYGAYSNGTAKCREDTTGTATTFNATELETQGDGKIGIIDSWVSGFTALYHYTKTAVVDLINGNSTRLEGLISSNITALTRYNQSLNTTSNVKFETLNVTTTTYLQFNQYICFGNSSHLCWSNITSNQTHLVERG